MKKKQILIEWIIGIIILVMVLPYLNVKISADKEEMFNFFRYQIRYISPITIVSLIISQVWRIKKANGFTRIEILKSFIPFKKTKIKHTKT